MQLLSIEGGRAPMIMPVTVFSATAIVEGAVLVTGASTTAQGAVVLVTLDTTDVLNVVGVTQVSSSLATQSKENLGQNASAWHIGSDGFPNEGTAGSLDYLPLSINPDAIYLAVHSTTTAAGTASDNVATWTAGTTTAAQRGTTGTDVLGGWLFSLSGVNSAGNTPTFSGSLRYISNQSATTHVTLLTAMNISTDSHMIWADRTWKRGGVLNSTADRLRSQSGSTGTGFQLNGTKIMRMENYMVADTMPLHPLRPWVDDGRNGMSNPRVFGAITFPSQFLINGPSS